MRHHQRRDLQLLDDIGNCERLSRAGRAQQHRMLAAFLDAFNKLSDRLGLVAGWFEWGT